MYSLRMFRRYPGIFVDFRGCQTLASYTTNGKRECCFPPVTNRRSTLSRGGLLHSSGNYLSTITDTNKESSHSFLPEYLRKHYWWAYINPTMIQILDRQWLVDIVLWGNFTKLRDAALSSLRSPSQLMSPALIHGKTLQVSCVYANLTETLVKSLASDAELHVVDVVPAQLKNQLMKLLRNPTIKASDSDKVTLSCLDASNLCSVYPDTAFDNLLIFFLLHETPDDVRRRVVAEACRVLKNGGTMVIIDYHKPTTIFWRCMMSFMYHVYEPFAKDLWKQSLLDLFPPGIIAKYQKDTFFGGLYQKIVVTKSG
jgi:SAM-dependent methyltransferase